jgi:hypothetical protein
MTTTEITGYHRTDSGLLEPVTLPVIDGDLCDPRGYPLARTDETAELVGWGESDGPARVWINEGGREILVPEPEPDRITADTTLAEITAHLDSLGVDYTETPDGIRCFLPGDRRLNLYQHSESDGADIAGLWAWYLVGDCSGGLDSFGELAELVS